MDNKHIFISIAVAIYAGVRLYQKYGKKKDPAQATTKQNELSSSKDDYEPYSGK